MTQRTATPIDGLLADTLIQAMMRADKVEPEALRALLDGAAGRIAATRRDAAAPRPGGLAARAPFERRPARAGAAASPRPRAARSPECCGSGLW